MKRSQILAALGLGLACVVVAVAGIVEHAARAARSEGYTEGFDDGQAEPVTVRLLAPQPVPGPRLAPDPTPAPGGAV